MQSMPYWDAIALNCEDILYLYTMYTRITHLHTLGPYKHDKDKNVRICVGGGMSVFVCGGVGCLCDEGMGLCLGSVSIDEKDMAL